MFLQILLSSLYFYLYTRPFSPGGFSLQCPVVIQGNAGSPEPSNTHPYPPGCCWARAQPWLACMASWSKAGSGQAGPLSKDHFGANSWTEKWVHTERSPFSCSLWNAEFAHFLLLCDLVGLQSRHPFSMHLPVGTDWFLSESVPKTIPSKRRLLIRVLPRKASFLTENHQHLSASNV